MRSIFIFSFLLVALNALSQAKKPTILIVPSDNWCIQNGFMLDFDNQGKVTRVPDYKRAVQESSDLLMAIGKINELMINRGFPPKSLEAALKTLESEAAENAMMTSSSGAEVNESPVDKLKKTAKADIIMQVSWKVNTVGPQRSVSFILEGLDAYTDKSIATVSGTGTPTFTAELPVLLETAVLSYIDQFNGMLQTHFDDMFANGREVILRIKTWGSWEHNLETEDFGDDELGALIEKWVSDNTVQGRFNTTDATENMMLFEQVRIPLFDAENKAIDARKWANGLRKYLKETYQIESKLMMKGLGQASLVLGEK